MKSPEIKHIRPRRADAFDQTQIAFGGVAAVHAFEDLVAA